MRDGLEFWWRNPSRRLYLLTLVCLAWLGFYTAQWHRVDKELANARRLLGNSAETVFVPPAPVLRMASLGHQSFAADLMYLRAAHYFVRHLITDSQLPWLDVYLEGIWALDAHNLSTYRWAPQVVKFGQNIDQSVAERANRFARLGLAYFPDDPWLYHEIAFNLRYTYQPKDDADQQRLRGLALAYLDTAYSFPGFSYDPNYLAGQYARAGRDEDAVQAALTTYEQATEDQRRALRSLLADKHKGELSQSLAWYDATKARDWPWLADLMVAQIGPQRVLAPPLQAHDPAQWLRERPTDADLLGRLAAHRLQPPADELLPADEQPLPAPTDVALEKE